MNVSTLFPRKRVIPLLLVAGALASGVAVKESVGSDHQQTALTELNPHIDITDVWAFPGSSDDRIVVAMTLSSPIVGNNTFVGNRPANFDPNALYQIKVDNNQDGIEDLVIQFSFDQLADGSQTVDVLGPVPPREINQFGVGVRDGFSTSTPVVRRGALNSNLTGQLPAVGSVPAGSMQVFAGLRDDPFFVDLEQFFRIIPDRRPTLGPLGFIGGVVPPPPGTLAVAFRPNCGPNNQLDPGESGPFDTRFGCAVDFLRGLNALAVVVELPEAQLTRGQGNGQIGIWATASQ